MNIQDIYESFFDTYRNMGYMISELSSALLRRAAERASTRSTEAAKARGRVRGSLGKKLAKDSSRKADQAEKFRMRADAQDQSAETKAKKEGERSVRIASDRADKRYGKTGTSTSKEVKTGADTGNLRARGTERVRTAPVKTREMTPEAKAKKAQDVAKAKSDAAKNLSDVEKANDAERKSAGFVSDKARKRAKTADKKTYKKQLFGGGISRAEKARLNKRYK